MECLQREDIACHYDKNGHIFEDYMKKGILCFR